MGAVTSPCGCSHLVPPHGLTNTGHGLRHYRRPQALRQDSVLTANSKGSLYLSQCTLTLLRVLSVQSSLQWHCILYTQESAPTSLNYLNPETTAGSHRNRRNWPLWARNGRLSVTVDSRLTARPGTPHARVLAHVLFWRSLPGQPREKCLD